ncbi:hypothetical protein [Streptomyces rhizosphaerihabitans]|uniref:hypothetical protein n=1 Tax=Streptomyces rhizosphaerihabitans TaxID=1266770 RepID=UPI0021C15191|nr:hypothetical protein [Streptomyces rhizosphaerihabitans]MCT9003577.1 hypothetical protein [Streptomyces rhizosphaerihabitans]
MSDSPLDERRADMDARGRPVQPREVLGLAESMMRRLAEEHEAALGSVLRERNHLAAWLAAFHPSVLAAAPDAGVGWRRLFLRAGGWQFTWPIPPADLSLFDHVRRVPVGDARARFDGHTTDQKYLRIRTHTAVLGLSDDTST